MTSSADAEWFDVVDEEDRVIGRETRSEVHRKRLLHRAVHLFVFRPDGSLFLQKRSASKDTAPNRWVSSCSGHVDSGEDYEEAASREIREELGIPADTIHLEEKCAVKAVPETGNEFVRLYAVFDFEGTIEPDPGEISDGCWKTPADIERWLTDKPDDFSDSFRYLWKIWKQTNPS
ncbi:MAG: NUDIX domain-containing protein [Verrucomicrobiota bacterium]